MYIFLHSHETLPHHNAPGCGWLPDTNADTNCNRDSEKESHFLSIKNIVAMKLMANC